MEWLADVLKIRPGEGRIVALLASIIAVISAGTGMGAASVNALFFSRFGVEYLPYLYIALGLVTFLNLMAVAGLLGRFPQERVYAYLPIALIVVLVVFRLMLASNLRWVYPVLFVGKEVVISLQSVLLWGLAGTFFEARQAKRLFPLLVSGGIAGISLGSIVTPVLVGVLGSENILLAWAVILVVGYALIRWLPGYEQAGIKGTKTTPSSKTRHSKAVGASSFGEEIRRGYQFVRQSSLMRWLALSSVLFSVLWFSILLPFSRAAAAQYPDADALAGFLGLFQGVQNGIALLVSLLLTNRLFARFGLMNMLLVFPAIYLGGFAWLVLFASFQAIIVFRLVKLVWSQSIAETAWQASFNVVPSERRGQAYTFFNAVPGQAGIVISGVILVIGEKALPPQQLYWIGLVAAIACLATMWQARRAYTQALVEALRAGQAHVFFSDEEPFGGVQRDASAVPVILSGLADPHPGVRRLSAEILEELAIPQAVGALLKAVGDNDGEVREAALRALAATDPAAAAVPSFACLEDPLPAVRCQAIQVLVRASALQADVLEKVRSLRNDPQPAVRARAAMALASAGDLPSALAILSSLMTDPAPEVRALAVGAAGECWSAVEADRAPFLQVMLDGLADQNAVVRRATATALAAPPVELVDALVQNLGDEDSAVRQETAAALGRAGEVAQQAILAALNDARLLQGGLQALENLPVTPPPEALRSIAGQEVSLAVKYHRMASGLAAISERPAARGKVQGQLVAGERASLLVEGLREKARGHALNALHAIGLLTDRQKALLSIENLQSQERDQRAYALETLEAIGEAQLVRPLIPIWESGEVNAESQDGLLTEVLHDPDAWLRACGALFASMTRDEQSLAILTRLSQRDPDPLVRETASQAVQGGIGVNTLQTISTMERVLFLRRVKLFANLKPVDLMQIAAIAREHLFPDGEVIAQLGDSGDEMYIIVSGEVGVVNERGHEMARRKQGDYVGEMAIISQQPRMATLVAAGEVRTLCIGRKPFEEILRGRFEISLAVMRELCERLKQSSVAEVVSKS